jgi:hypothetical protein
MKYILTLILLVSLASCAEEPNLPVGEKAAYVPHSENYEQINSLICMKVIIIDRDSLYELCHTNMNILPDVGDTLNVGELHGNITCTQVIKKEWVVADGREPYVVIIVKIKKS